MAVADQRNLTYLYHYQYPQYNRLLNNSHTSLPQLFVWSDFVSLFRTFTGDFILRNRLNPPFDGRGLFQGLLQKQHRALKELRFFSPRTMRTCSHPGRVINAFVGLLVSLCVGLVHSTGIGDGISSILSSHKFFSSIDTNLDGTVAKEEMIRHVTGFGGNSLDEPDEIRRRYGALFSSWLGAALKFRAHTPPPRQCSTRVRPTGH